MNDNTETSSSRIFKTAWFAKAAKKALITNEALCLAIQQVILGQIDDLGGGVFKKRLNNKALLTLAWRIKLLKNSIIRQISL